MPLFDKEGRRRGIIIMNILAQKLLHMPMMLKPEKGLDVLIVNSEGYYVHHSTAEEKEWGGLADLNTENSLKTDFSGTYEKILSEERGSIYSSDCKKYLFFQRIRPFPDKNRFLTLIITAERGEVLAILYRLSIFILVVILFILAVFYSVSRCSRKKIEKYEEKLHLTQFSIDSSSLDIFWVNKDARIIYEDIIFYTQTHYPLQIKDLA